MKKIFLSATAIVTVISASAFAADLPSIKAAPAVAPVPMWTGFYAGINLGGNAGTNSGGYSENIGSSPVPMHTKHTGAEYPANQTLSLAGVGLAQSGQFSMSQSGVVGGGQIGYNYQLSPKFVVGFETDFQGTSTSGNSYISSAGGTASDYAVSLANRYTGAGSAGALGGQYIQSQVNWFGTARARLGYLVTPNMLLFATGGLTYGSVSGKVSSITINNVNMSDDASNALAPSYFNYNQLYFGGGQHSQLNVGWNSGLGVEWMFMDNWSLKGEAIYWNMGNMNVSTYSLASSVPNQLFNSQPTITSCTQSNTGVTYPECVAGGTVGKTSVNFQGIIARAGVNYHFNFANAAPVVAKF